MVLCKYINQLQDIAFENDVRLKDMFIVAGVPTSTYYRAINGMDLRFDTAERILKAFRHVQLQSDSSSNQS
jgi:predicted transcriptional regulator